jgi:hypothetical protein
MAGVILFADHVLLCEGDSEAILIPPLLQALTESGATKVDLNTFAVISTGNTRNTDALIRMIGEAAPQSKLAVLVDGDQGGKDRLKALKPVLTARNIPARALTKDRTIEDYLPYQDDLYVRAVAEYAYKLRTDYKVVPARPLDDLLAQAKVDHEAWKTAGNINKVGNWAELECHQLSGRAEVSPKIGIAREYVNLLADVPRDQLRSRELTGPRDLLEMINGLLDLPAVTDATTAILGN